MATIATIAVMQSAIAVALGLSGAVFQADDSLDRPDRAGIVVSTLLSSDGTRAETDVHSLAQSARLADSDHFDAVGVEVVAEGVAGDARPRVRLGEDGRLLSVAAVSSRYFAASGVRLRGPGFSAQADLVGGAPAVVLSRSFWQETLGAAPAIVGTRLNLNGRAVPVAGIVDSDFRGLVLGDDFDLWLSIGSLHEFAPTLPELLSLTPVRIVTRLRPGGTLAEARLWCQQALSRDARVALLANVRHPSSLRRGASRDLDLLVLLQALAAVTALLAVGTIELLTRSRLHSEWNSIATRLAVGASRWQASRPQACEALYVTGVGSGVGYASSAVVTASLAAMPLPSGVALTPASLSVGWTLWCLLVLATIVVTLFIVVRASFATTRVRGHRRGNHPRPGRRPVEHAWLVAGHAGCCVVLISAAITFAATASGVLETPMALDSSVVTTVSIQPRTLQYSKPDGSIDSARRLVDYRVFQDRLKAVPGVEDVAVGRLPAIARRLDGASGVHGLGKLAVAELAVGERYFETVGLRIKSGRDFLLEDRDLTPPAVVVNESLAASYSVGKSQEPVVVFLPRGAVRVVGVADDVIRPLGRARSVPTVFRFQSAEVDDPVLTLVVRTAGRKGMRADSVLSIAESVFPSPSATRVENFQTMIEREVSLERLGLVAFRAGALASVALAVFGSIAMVGSDAIRRSREWAIRSAVGASRRHILHRALASVARPMALGVAFGALVAYGVHYGLSRFVLDPPSTDLQSLAVAVICFVAFAVASALLAAHVSIRHDPASAVARADS